MRWAETLERLAALGADRLLTEFGPLVEGQAKVRERLTRTAEALRWLRRKVVARMNQGMSERELLADMSYPPELFDQPWMRPTYGAADYIVRDLFREENGWWDRNPTTLCRERAKQVTPIVSKRLYWSMAGLLADGDASWQAL